MDPDATLVWILRLRDGLDAALEGDGALDPDPVYALVGLLAELDAWLCAGRRAPRRWSASFAVAPSPLVLDGRDRASNDATGPGARRRRPLARRGGEAARSVQLLLPFTAAGAT